jgi:hypothetical protein
MVSGASLARSLKFLAVLSLAAGSLGCGSKMPSEEQSVDEFFKSNPQLKRVPVAKVAGRVTVDGQPPPAGSRLYVILSDPEHLVRATEPPQIAAVCEAQGAFAFTTFVTGDGVPYGKYVATFVSLHPPRGRGKNSGGAVRGLPVYVGPDDLKNLYNDPVKNKGDQAFLIDVQPPGRTNYEFNLSVAGKEAITTPGEYAVTTMR